MIMSPLDGGAAMARGSALITTYPRRVSVRSSPRRPEPSWPRSKICMLFIFMYPINRVSTVRE